MKDLKEAFEEIFKSSEEQKDKYEEKLAAYKLLFTEERMKEIINVAMEQAVQSARYGRDIHDNVYRKLRDIMGKDNEQTMQLTEYFEELLTEEISEHIYNLDVDELTGNLLEQFEYDMKQGSLP